MAILGVYTKQPSEKISITIDFAARLDTDETLSTATVTSINIADSSNSTSTIVTGAAVSGTLASFYLQAGTSGQTHQVTCLVTTSNSQILEEDITLIVKSNPLS